MTGQEGRAVLKRSFNIRWIHKRIKLLHVARKYVIFGATGITGPWVFEDTNKRAGVVNEGT